eukprot:g52782.t1
MLRTFEDPLRLSLLMGKWWEELIGLGCLAMPMVATSGYNEPFLAVGGTVLLGVLHAMTLSKPSSEIAEEEAPATSKKESVVIVSTTNRSVRAFLGVTHLAAAYLRGELATKQADGDAWALTRWGGVFILCFMSAIWGRGASKHPAWNPDGKGWRRMPKEFQAQYAKEFARTQRYAFPLGLGMAGLLRTYFTFLA